MATREAEKTSGTEAQPRPAVRTRQSFETWSWFFMRISGLALLFLALVHFALTHIATDVAKTDYKFLSHRWDNPLWRLFDWSLLALALAHGLNGLRYIIDDYVRRPATRAVVKAALYTVAGVLFAFGTLTILTFKAKTL